MIDLGFVHLLRPWWLLALPVAALLFWRSWRAGSLSGWTKAIDPQLLAALAARGHVAVGSRIAGLAPLAAVVLVAIALAGPALQQANLGAFRNLDGAVILLDASRSMTLGGNLPAARLAAGAVADAAAQRQTALILYAGDAYAVAPFVTDTALIKRLLSGVASETVPDFGSRPARALRLARRMLKEQSILEADVVLISDGGRFNKAALDETAALKRDGHAVHTVFVPATDSLPVFAPLPDRPALDRVAMAGSGIGSAVDDLQPLISRLSVSTAERLAQTSFGALAWADLGRYLLVIALFPALFLFGRAK